MKSIRELKGEEETWYADIKQPKFLIPKFFVLAISIYILIAEFGKLGEEKA